MEIPPAVARYWEALDRADGAAMAACYAPDARFRDPVFELEGEAVGAMWRMLLRPDAQVEVTTHHLSPTPDGAVGTWEARYTFSKGGRVVHNRIRSTFTASEAGIEAQEDRFPFWRWSRQALGARGVLLGWTPLVRAAVRKQARARLAKSMAKA